MEKQMKRIDLYRNAEDAMVGYTGFCADMHNDCAECRLFKGGEGLQGCVLRWAMENVHAQEDKKIAKTDKAWHFAGFLSENVGNVRAMWFARAMAEVVCAIKWDGVRYVTNAEVSIEAMKVDMEIIGASSIKKDNVK